MIEHSRHARVAAAVWPWRDREANAAQAKARARRRKSGLQSVVIFVVALVLLIALKHPVMGSVALVLSIAVLLAGRFAPRVYDAMDRLVYATARLVGGILTWILLVPCFVLIFIPARAIFMLSGKDPLCRRFGSERRTFWVSCAERQPGDYARQY